MGEFEAATVHQAANDEQGRQDRRAHHHNEHALSAFAHADFQPVKAAGEGKRFH